MTLLHQDCTSLYRDLGSRLQDLSLGSQPCCMSVQKVHEVFETHTAGVL